MSPGNERFVKSTVCSTQGRGKCERRDGVRAGPEEVGAWGGARDGAGGGASDVALRAETVLQIVTLVYILTFFSSVQFYCNNKIYDLMMDSTFVSTSLFQLLTVMSYRDLLRY